MRKRGELKIMTFCCFLGLCKMLELHHPCFLGMDFHDLPMGENCFKITQLRRMKLGELFSFFVPVQNLETSQLLGGLALWLSLSPPKKVSRCLAVDSTFTNHWTFWCPTKKVSLWGLVLASENFQSRRLPEAKVPRAEVDIQPVPQLMAAWPVSGQVIMTLATCLYLKVGSVW